MKGLPPAPPVLTPAYVLEAQMAVWLERAYDGQPPTEAEVADILRLWLPDGWVSNDNPAFGEFLEPLMSVIRKVEERGAGDA